MKPLRVVLIGLGVLALLMVVLIAFGFTPAVQTWAARRALAAEPGLSGQIGRIDVGLRHVRAENVVLNRPGMRLVLPAVRADVALLDLLKDRLHVHRLVAKGWTVDLSVPSPSGVAGAAPGASEVAMLPLLLAALTQESYQAAAPEGEPAGNRLPALRLPIDLAVDHVELEGEVILPAVADEAAGGRASVAVTGGGLAAGREGRFRIEADARMPHASSGVAHVSLRSEATARMSTPRTFQYLAIGSTLEATGPRLAEAARLAVDMTAGADASGVLYALDLRTPEKTLLAVKATPARADSGELRGDWRLELGHEDLAPFSLGYPLPNFDGSGEGTVDLFPDDRGVEAAGRLRVRVAELGKLRPELETVGAVTTDATFAARWTGQIMRVTSLALKVEDKAPVAEIVALQGLEVDLNTGELRVADPEADLLEIEVTGLPLEWARPLLEPYIASGGALQGAWIAAARDGGFMLQSVRPLRVGGVDVATNGERMVRDLDVAASLSAEFTPSGWQARIEQGRVQAGTTSLLEFDARAGQAAAPGAALVVTSRFAGNVGGWMDQPMMRDRQLFQSGRAKGEFIVALSERVELAAELELSDAIAAGGEALPEIAVEVRADQDVDGRVDAHVPLRVTRDGRASDLTLDGQARKDGYVWDVNAIAAGRHVFVEDLQLLALPFTTGDDEDPEEPRPDQPPWSGWEGALSFSFGTVVYNEHLTAKDVNGQIRFGGGELRVSDLEAGLGTGGSVGFIGGVAFDPRGKEPYLLDGRLSASEVEAGELMRAVSPGTTPPVEGKFDLTATISGRASDLSQLASAAAAEARMSSSGGTVHALSVDVSKYARTGSALAGVAGIIGSITGDSRTQRYAERFRAATELAQQLNRLAFDQLNIEVTRRPGEAIIIEDLNLISPMIRLLGSGSIGDQPAVPFWREPLHMRLQLAAREAMAAHLGTLNLLRREPDALGYLPMIEDFQLQGSLENVTTRQLESLLTRALSNL